MPLPITQAAGILVHPGEGVPLTSSLDDSNKPVIFLARSSPTPLGLSPGLSISHNLRVVKNNIAASPLTQFPYTVSCTPNYDDVLRGVMQKLLKLHSVDNLRPTLMEEITQPDVIRQAGGLLFSFHVLQRSGDQCRHSCTENFKRFVSMSDNLASIQHVFSAMARESHRALQARSEPHKYIGEITGDFFATMELGVKRTPETKDEKASCKERIAAQYSPLSERESFYEDAAEGCINGFVRCFNKGR